MKIRFKLTPEGSNKSAWDFCTLSRQILRYANMGVSRTEFIKLILKMFIDFSKCDSTEFISKEDDKYFRGILLKNRSQTFIFEVINAEIIDGKSKPLFKNISPQEELYSYILSDQVRKTPKYFTKSGSMWIPDTDIPISLNITESETVKNLNVSGIYKSIIVLPFQINTEDNGLLVLKSRKKHFFTRNETEFYETVSQTIGISVSDRRAQFSLRERIKELSCLYDINKIIQNRQYEFDEVIQNITDILPSAFLLPQYASARIVLNTKEYKSKNFRESKINIVRPVKIWGENKGYIEISYYFDKQPETTDILFLREEISLLDAVAYEISKFTEHQQLEDEKQRISVQLRHADKLATIGQLSAGIAHELNEPLTIILGFAQLIKKNPVLPEQIEKDIDKIINAAIYGREIIKKLLIFARQMPTKKAKVNINNTISDLIQFFDLRLKKENIVLIQELKPDIPEIEADPSQITQVLMNIIVNAIQAMPQGGTLTIKTSSKDDYIMIIVSDTGTGMSEEVKRVLYVNLSMGFRHETTATAAEVITRLGWRSQPRFYT
ncbi:MAG: ATP-binding protein, partial [Deltaproteobacteria bacterium]|nr:ATP-binding protein [Deltaproteobacteria bacterium]